MSCLRVAAPPSPLGVSTPRDLAGKDHGHGMVGLPPVLSARLVAQARAQAWQEKLDSMTPQQREQAFGGR